MRLPIRDQQWSVPIHSEQGSICSQLIIPKCAAAAAAGSVAVPIRAHRDRDNTLP